MESNKLFKQRRFKERHDRQRDDNRQDKKLSPVGTKGSRYKNTVDKIPERKMAQRFYFSVPT